MSNSDMLRALMLDVIREEMSKLLAEPSELAITGERKRIDASDYEVPKGAHVDVVERASKTPVKRQPRGSNTVYAIQYRGKTEPILFNTAEQVWKAVTKLASKGKAVTEAAVIQATGLKMKTVQSCIWHLRNYDAKGTRVEPGSRTAMLVSRVAE